MSKEALQIAEKGKESKDKAGKERYTHFECRVPKKSKERFKKPSTAVSAKK